MNKEQIKTIASFGYAVEEVPHKDQPKITLYKKDMRVGAEWNGDWIEMPNMPADPKALRKYLSRGFVIQPPPREKQEDNPFAINDKEVK
uniref:Uncharacterized protein n=1 Tax=viral metagenome TaxID=1070528 RepID=A0A6M3KU02_9ZZZZ